MDVKVFTRRDRLSKTDDELVEEASRLKDIQKEYKTKLTEIRMEKRDRLGALLLNDKAPGTIVHRKTAEVIVEEGKEVTQDIIEAIEVELLENLLIVNRCARTIITHSLERI